MKIPFHLLALDLLGMVLLGLGLAERFAATDLVPAALRFANYDIALIVGGVLLMIPLIGFVARRAAQQRP